MAPRKTEKYCFCRRPDDGKLMVRCDNCLLWFHGKCVNFQGDVELDQAWICAVCAPKLLKQVLEQQMYFNGTANDNFSYLNRIIERQQLDITALNQLVKVPYQTCKQVETSTSATQTDDQGGKSSSATQTDDQVGKNTSSATQTDDQEGKNTSSVSIQTDLSIEIPLQQTCTMGSIIETNTAVADTTVPPAPRKALSQCAPAVECHPSSQRTLKNKRLSRSQGNKVQAKYNKDDDENKYDKDDDEDSNFRSLKPIKVPRNLKW